MGAVWPSGSVTLPALGGEQGTRRTAPHAGDGQEVEGKVAKVAALDEGHAEPPLVELDRRRRVLDPQLPAAKGEAQPARRAVGRFHRTMVWLNE